MITRVQVKNYRGLADVDVSLSELTVLVGRNGAGKSTFLDVIRFVRDALQNGLDAAVTKRHGIDALVSWSSSDSPANIGITLTVETQWVSGEYHLTLNRTAQDSYKIIREQGRAEYKTLQGELPFGKPILEKDAFLMEEGEIKQSPELLSLIKFNANPGLYMLGLPTFRLISQPLNAIYLHLTQAGLYSLFPNTLQEPQNLSLSDKLHDDGENLSATLRLIKSNDVWFKDLTSAFSKAIDGVRDARVRQVGGYLVTELKHHYSEENSPWFALTQESDGTLRMLGLLVALYQSGPVTLIGIEEPEIALHPGALNVLVDVLREVSQRRQILITTQSPDLISKFTANELRVVERHQGGTTIGPVGETQRRALNDQLFTAGDLLRIEDLHNDLTTESEAVA